MFRPSLLFGATLFFSLGNLCAQIALARPPHLATEPAPLATRFDFPVGKLDGAGYYKARGFSANHPGEDWDGIGGGNSDFDDPINSIADGAVVFAQDVHRGWGKVVIVRYAFEEDGETKTIDALFAHLNRVFVRRGERVALGQEIATMGTGDGLYSAHLHFEIRKNLQIGVNRAAYPCDFKCYYDPTKFILAHRDAPMGRDEVYACARVLTLRSDAHPSLGIIPPAEPPSSGLTALVY
jgi:murein DD-endopeptidase MepM/ murein hydrolase activator NlpD